MKRTRERLNKKGNKNNLMPAISHKTWKAFKPFLERGIQTELFASESEQWVTITDKDNNL